MSSKPRLWISRPTFDDVVARLAEHFEVEAEVEERTLPAAQLRACLARQDAAIVGLKETVGAADVADARRLRIVANLAVGYDNIDVPAMTSAGIVASHTAGALDDSVADFAWALMLGTGRRMVTADRWVRAGQWRQSTRFLEWLGNDLYASTLGIVGMGRIGQAIARRATGFRARVLYHNRHRLDAGIERECGNAEYVDLPTLLRESDAVVLVVPRTNETYHLIGAEQLRLMKPSAVLVNVARGGIVDEAALAVALREGQLAGAGLDVFDGEPAVPEALLALDNVIVCPHIASATVTARHNMASMAADCVMATFGFGKPVAATLANILNPAVLKRADGWRSA